MITSSSSTHLLIPFLIYVQRAVHTSILAATSHTTAEWGEKILDYKVLDQIISKLHIHGLEDWYLVPKSHIQLVEGSFKLLKRHEIFSFVISFPSSLFSSPSSIYSLYPHTIFAQNMFSHHPQVHLRGVPRSSLLSLPLMALGEIHSTFRVKTHFRTTDFSGACSSHGIS